MKTTAENIAKQKKLQDECDPKMKHASKRSGAALNYTDPKQPKRSATPSSDITDVKNKGRTFTFMGKRKQGWQQS